MKRTAQMTESERELADKIARVMKEGEWTLGRVAKLAKVSKPTISRIISGKESSWQSILAVAIALGIRTPEPANYLSSKEEISVVQRWRGLAGEDQAWVTGLMQRLAQVAEEQPGQPLADILPMHAPPPAEPEEPEEERRELPYYGEVAAFERWSPEYVGSLEPEGLELVCSRNSRACGTV